MEGNALGDSLGVLDGLAVGEGVLNCSLHFSSCGNLKLSFEKAGRLFRSGEFSCHINCHNNCRLSAPLIVLVDLGLYSDLVFFKLEPSLRTFGFLSSLEASAASEPFNNNNKARIGRQSTECLGILILVQ